jgi:hypothetical protein
MCGSIARWMWLSDFRRRTAIAKVLPVRSLQRPNRVLKPPDRLFQVTMAL